MATQVEQDAAIDSSASTRSPMARTPARSARPAAAWRAITRSGPSCTMARNAPRNASSSEYDCDGPCAAL